MRWRSLLLLAFGVQFEDAHGVTTDGVIYFSQLRSVLFDGDLNVAKEFAYLGQPPRPYHVVPIGPTIVWLPLYLAVAGIDAIGRGAGLWAAPADPIAIGLTLPYVRAALVSSFAIGAIGLFVVHRHLRGGFDKGVAFATTTLLVRGDAADLVHGLRAVDDTRRVIRLRGDVRRGGGAMDVAADHAASVDDSGGVAGAGVRVAPAGSDLRAASGRPAADRPSSPGERVCARRFGSPHGRLPAQRRFSRCRPCTRRFSSAARTSRSSARAAIWISGTRAGPTRCGRRGTGFCRGRRSPMSRWSERRRT